MSEVCDVGAYAIIPNSDLRASQQFWERMDFQRTGGAPDYRIMTGWGCEVHLVQAGKPPWNVPEHNPFGVFIRTPEVDKIAALVDDLIIRPGGILRHREWGMYEFGMGGPDGMLIRVGWPSRLMREGQ